MALTLLFAACARGESPEASTPPTPPQASTEVQPTTDASSDRNDNRTEAEKDVYVSPDGNDENAGTEASPLRTFAGARDFVRKLLDGEGDVTVYFRGGDYVLEESVVLGQADGGSATQVVTYAAFPGETPVFTSLTRLTGWERVDDKILRARLPDEITHVRFLWDGQSEWLPRSSTDSFLATEASTVEDGCLECNWNLPEAQSARSNVAFPADFDTPDWSRADQYDLRESTNAWLQEILPIARVDQADRRIFTTIPASLEMRLNFEEAENLNRNWILNTLEGIDSPGEWASLDGYVYLYPSTDVSDIRVPSLTELVRVDDGTPDGNQEIDEPVEYIRFDGLTFTGGDFYVMSDSDVTIQHDWSVVDAPTALLRLRNTANIEVRNTVFEKSGSTGLRIDRYGQNIVVSNNTFSNLGREAITLIGRGPGYGNVNSGNEITFNSIRRTGMEKWTAPALVIEQSSNNSIRQNYISDTQFTAVVLTAPRQLAFASHYEDSPTYLGREFHYWEVAPAVLDKLRQADDELVGSYEAMRQVYNYNNVVEMNTLVDVGQGAGYLVNGYVYNSAVKRGERNYFNYNYVRDTGNNQVNNAVFYSDSDQDETVYLGNMISGVQNADEQPETIPILLLFAMYAEGEFNEGTTIQALANVIVGSGYPSLADGINYEMLGTITDATTGTEEYLDTYQNMARILESGELPGGPELPGYDLIISAVQKTIATLD